MHSEWLSPGISLIHFYKVVPIVYYKTENLLLVKKCLKGRVSDDVMWERLIMKTRRLTRRRRSWCELDLTGDFWGVGWPVRGRCCLASVSPSYGRRRTKTLKTKQHLVLCFYLAAGKVRFKAVIKTKVWQERLLSVSSVWVRRVSCKHQTEEVCPTFCSE